MNHKAAANLLSTAENNLKDVQRYIKEGKYADAGRLLNGTIQYVSTVRVACEEHNEEVKKAINFLSRDYL